MYLRNVIIFLILIILALIRPCSRWLSFFCCLFIFILFEQDKEMYVKSINNVKIKDDNHGYLIEHTHNSFQAIPIPFNRNFKKRNTENI